ncbi:hypothetical protein [Rhizobium leguminosarum]|uniref:hypothetical protein n=1 Tax=Rhizobium leguminosarum TaxID=384 RepID=UPI00102FC126|nr:hypothetical protein [Rhizobium leguminosarum]TBF65672.1 hypothetical protein ELG89_34520 [Rhizobium leguminosarum]
MFDKWLGTPPDVIIPRLKLLVADLDRLAARDRNISTDEAVLIRNCMLVSRSVPCLMGEFFGHPEVKNGPGITSELFYLDKKLKLGRTLSRWYRFDEGFFI